MNKKCDTNITYCPTHIMIHIDMTNRVVALKTISTLLLNWDIKNYPVASLYHDRFKKA